MRSRRSLTSSLRTTGSVTLRLATLVKKLLAGEELEVDEAGELMMSSVWTLETIMAELQVETDEGENGSEEEEDAGGRTRRPNPQSHNPLHKPCWRQGVISGACLHRQLRQ